MPSITVKDNANVDQVVQTLPAVGQGTMAASLPVCIASNQSSIPVTVGNASLAVTGPLTDTQLRASAVGVTVSNATLAVTGTFWQATQPVSGPLTDTQLRATAVPVSGPLTDTQLRATAVPVSGTVTVGNASIAVTGTFWQATQPVSGPLTDTQLRASAVPVSLASLPSVDLLAKSNENSATFTRPADTVAYASGDLIGNSTTAASVTRMNFTTAARVAAGSGVVRRARIKKSTNVITGASFRLHLFKADPGAFTVGDNVALGTTVALANWIGAMDCTMTQQGSDGAKGIAVPVEGSEITFKLASGQIVYGFLEARGAYTPGSAEVFIVDLELMQD